MVIDTDAAYRALQSRDSRFDGVFFVGVHTTGIYCRPSCAARTPLRRNVDFYPSAAAAQRSGFRACKRCRPDATPGSPEWNVRADLAGRAVRMISDGVVDRSGVSGLADALGYSERQVTRALLSEVGAPPLALARAQRAQTARILLERTQLPVTDVAFAAGFASVRQFNDTVREIFDATPTQLRTARRASARPDPTGSTRPVDPGVIELRLPFRAPMNLEATVAFLSHRAIGGIEAATADGYTRALPLPHGPGLVTLRPATDHVRARLRLTDQRDLSAAVNRIRRLLDLDADPQAIDEVLGRQPELRPWVRRRPGLRSPGSVDSFEMAVRAIVGQQISVAGARTVLASITRAYSPVVSGLDPDGSWRLFPSAERLAGIDPAQLPMPLRRGQTIVRVAQAMATGELVLDPGSDRPAARARLLALSGIGPWTADYLLMRAIGDPDVYLAEDLGVRHALDLLAPSPADGGRRTGPDPASAAPWRSYLTHHLWAALSERKPRPNKENS
ncbi:helix-turn-helix domain-containing protein [Jatrophihabitans telluris]|uniref:DNA-3-methyladenine glycosylase II n=1 Tax=Jatrophihabitans telluris TaxID=2038343 RepID=A0ABY4R0X6_9ACTN|nr:AlkA N-terminal domain-containing protein [Jatrophihabitans telluris]UQX89350.1 helix-turn-helix domain-containing protein [Jatrophihabitans telluris]